MDEWFEVEVFTNNGLGRICTTTTEHGGIVFDARRFLTKEDAGRVAAELFPGRSIRVYRVTKDGQETAE